MKRSERIAFIALALGFGGGAGLHLGLGFGWFPCVIFGVMIAGPLYAQWIKLASEQTIVDSKALNEK